MSSHLDLRLVRRWFGWALLLLASLFMWAARAQPLPSVDLDRLSEQAALTGQVRVLVGLNVDAVPEGLLHAREVLAQRANTQAAQAAIDRLLAGTQTEVFARFENIPFVGLSTDANGMARLRASGLVRVIEEDRLARRNLQESAPLVSADDAWAQAATGAGWAVAVLDTGVDKTHAFLAGKVVAEACYSTNNRRTAYSLCPGGVSSSTAAGSGVNCAVSQYGDGCQHGTHVAGIVAGANGPGGAAGVAKGAGVIAVQVFSYFPSYQDVLSYTSDQIKGLERVYALRGDHAIAAVNMSLGGGQYSSTCDSSNTAIKAAIDNLRSVGIATVIASGNNGYLNAISAPACVSSAISVGATCDTADTGYCATGLNGVAGYSNIAGFMSLLAPGSYINSSVPGGGYANWSGTSMATPHVAGAWAVLKSAQPSLSVSSALNYLRSTGLLVSDTRSGGSVSGLRRIDLATLPTPVSTNVLSVARSGTGSGQVASSPVGISCGAVCSASFDANTSVTLSATANAGSAFVGWGGACSGSAPTCTVLVSEAKAVSASFELQTLKPLMVTKSGTGVGTVTSSPAGISCGNDCTESYPTGALVTLSAKAAGGSRFSGWSGPCTLSGNSCTVAMTDARAVTATFNKR
ncbi:MAG: S8 family serine peptidase [Hydrogenophaga sp.]|nr:S8 family serine peptidase [Hydrogenophaga sp.]